MNTAKSLESGDTTPEHACHPLPKTSSSGLMGVLHYHSGTEVICGSSSSTEVLVVSWMLGCGLSDTDLTLIIGAKIHG